ncbi:hypothetical protein RA19_13625 [Leisingera sp. ANG-M1]|uniref:hypothetical protein n=1 Tax=Leisingera sp. ANG-M1 TaxID=1577895 RepID=UPI00057EB89B|nr:hypothetical protein [Leisingera sp. ANG-M1]KIC09810.1 hypothetical protein RA19_13625 [Leisingera sp. ANG-M1]
MKLIIALMVICHPAPLLADGVIECLEQLESRLALLERQIIASPAACDTLGPGWTRFEGATGRFLMGDDSDEEVRETGGRPSVKLEVPNLPPHNHHLPTMRRVIDEHQPADGFQPGWAFQNSGRNWVGGSPVNGNRLETNFVGEAKEFSIIPPFVEVSFCTKSD